MLAEHKEVNAGPIFTDILIQTDLNTANLPIIL
jgi:hypothetical protein